MAANEKTSKRVSAIAGRLLAVKVRAGEFIPVFDIKTECIVEFKWADIRALAASALTQAADKPKKKSAR
jgi:hypothetical protein